MMTIFVEPTGPASGSATTGTGDITTDLTAPIVAGPLKVPVFRSCLSELERRWRRVGVDWMTPAFYSDTNPRQQLVM